MTDKQTDTKTYNCVYCNKTLTKFETQPLYKDGEFLTTCEECWNKHAKEEGYVVSDVQTINITIDDLINGNLRDMEITAQFGVYRQAVKGLAEQLKAKEQECEELNKWLPIVTRLEEQFKSHEKAKSINYKTYAEQVFTELDQLKEEHEKLKVWKSITPLKTKMLVKALTEIKEIAYELTNEEYTDFIESKQEQILQKISEVLDV